MGIERDLGHLWRYRTAVASHGRVSQDPLANAFGNFRTLMQQMTLDPTMGDYLNMAAAQKATLMRIILGAHAAIHGRARYVESGWDGPVCRAQSLPNRRHADPTYDQTNVNNLTKVFTGWNYCQDPNLAMCPNFTNAYPGNTTYNLSIRCTLMIR